MEICFGGKYNLKEEIGYGGCGASSPLLHRPPRRPPFAPFGFLRADR
jgi:hypothetical protein